MKNTYCYGLVQNLAEIDMRRSHSHITNANKSLRIYRKTPYHLCCVPNERYWRKIKKENFIACFWMFCSFQSYWNWNSTFFQLLSPELMQHYRKTRWNAEKSTRDFTFPSLVPSVRKASANLKRNCSISREYDVMRKRLKGALVFLKT